MFLSSSWCFGGSYLRREEDKVSVGYSIMAMTKINDERSGEDCFDYRAHQLPSH